MNYIYFDRNKIYHYLSSGDDIGIHKNQMIQFCNLAVNHGLDYDLGDKLEYLSHTPKYIPKYQMYIAEFKEIGKCFSSFYYLKIITLCHTTTIYFFHCIVLIFTIFLSINTSNIIYLYSFHFIVILFLKLRKDIQFCFYILSHWMFGFFLKKKTNL